MFSPIKGFITYIQKNANSNSLFGGNSTIEGSTKMETINLKTEANNSNIKSNESTESDIKEEIDNEESSVEQKEDSDEIQQCDEIKDSNSERKSNTLTTTTCTLSIGNSSEVEEDDIEEQIESSIMLKTPVKVTSTNVSEILELKKSSTTNSNIVISHDFNRNDAVTPIDDELEDFRNDPMEILDVNSSYCGNPPADQFCLLENGENISVKDYKSKTEDDRREVFDSDIDAEEDKYVDHITLTDMDDEEEPFLDLNNFKSRNVIVLDEVDLNTSTTSIDTNNTSDDPLAIACEEQEAFASDKASALQDLNLLSNSQTSQDEDTRTTDDDFRWLKTDPESSMPSCKVTIKDDSTDVAPEKEERNGDGSDSGLGSETLGLQTSTSITDTSHLNVTTASPKPANINKSKDNEDILDLNVSILSKSHSNEPAKPYRSNLKRRLEVVDDAAENLDTLKSTLSSLTDHSSLNGSIQKKPKRSINFDTVEVYYFPRQQGFGCVPSAGGCTLGMGSSHIAFKSLTLAEHAAELRRAHRMQLQDINQRGSSSDDSEESEEDYLSEGSGSDLDGESNGFLQPVSPKQRRALLKAAGIRKIDPSEKAECRNIRNSREVCGCTCRDFCDPETCACSQSGIKCQVDRDMFPCGCSRDACGNTIGRVEFNPTRVRTHYIHTLMRLEMENRQQQNPYSSAVASPIQTTSSPYYQTNLQPQSNYSSGYASPAYNSGSEVHQPSAAGSYYQNPSTSNTLYGQQTSLEVAHSVSVNSNTTSHYGIDTLDANLFSVGTITTSAYGEMIPVSSYHYGNMQPQASAYNMYHNNLYINANSNNTITNTSNTYSSCAVPSLPPFGTATTTEATGVYHSVNNLTRMETTTAPSCTVSGATSLESDTSTNFISLSTPIASSSRLSQINDLLQHNRNAATALVAVSQNIETTTEIESASTTCLAQANDSDSRTSGTSLQDVQRGCTVFEEMMPPLEPSQQVTIKEDYCNNGPAKQVMLNLPAATEEESSTLINSECSAQASLHKDDKEVAVSATVEISTIEVAAGE